jgi:hypothetical protein
MLSPIYRSYYEICEKLALRSSENVVMRGKPLSLRVSASEVTLSGLAGGEYLPLPASKGPAFPFPSTALRTSSAHPRWVPHSSSRFRSGTTVFLQQAIKLKNEKSLIRAQSSFFCFSRDLIKDHTKKQETLREGNGNTLLIFVETIYGNTKGWRFPLGEPFHP